MTTNPLQLKPEEINQAIRNFQLQPNEYIDRVLGRTTTWEKQREINNAIARAIQERKNVAVRSCNSSGKTWDIASIACWFLTCFAHSNLITTAPTFRQVEQLLWRDIRLAYRNSIVPLGGTMLNTRWDIDIDWFAIGLSTDQPENFQGFHAPYIMVIVDEASGVDEDIMEAVDGVLAGGNATLVMLGNPTRTSGRFARSFKDPNVIKLHISGLDTPNVQAGRNIIPGLMSFDFPEKMAREYGKDSDLYRIKVLGEFPKAEVDTLVSVDDIENARRRDLGDVSKLKKKMGVDVARFGDDDSVLIIRQGGKPIRKEKRHGQDTAEIGGLIMRIAKEEGIEASDINVDAIGVGAGVVDYCHDKEFYVNGINVADTATDSETYVNVRAEASWEMRKAFKNGEIQLPANDDDYLEIANIKYKFPSGKIQIESKEDMKKRGLKSPDTADALMLTYVVSPPAAGLFI